MIVKYDALSRLEQPALTLCNPGSVYTSGKLSNVVGILTDVSDCEVVLNFNATSELNFRITKVKRVDSSDTTHVYNMFKAVLNRRLVFLENIGYFMITNVEDGYDANTKQSYKDVKAESIDIEIAQKMIPFIDDGTYRFSSDVSTNTKGLFETIVETLPLWTIGTVDSSVSEKYRTFEDVDVTSNCLGFMLQDMQDAYECIFVFDIVSRTINVYSQDNYVQQTSIHITHDDIVNSIEVTEDADDLYTAISVRGDDENVTIGAINPLGTNTIYNFDYYLSWMTSGLSAKVSAWQTAVSNAESSYYATNLDLYTAMGLANNYRLELEKIKTQITMYRRCRDNIVAESSTSTVADYNSAIMENGGEAITIESEIEDTLAGIDALIATCESEYEDTADDLAETNTNIETYRSQIATMRSQLDMSTYFTSAELEELNNYIFEGSYSDDYVTITDIMTYPEKFDQMKVLYDRAKARLERVSQPTQEFNVDTENFIFIKDFAEWTEQLETGCLINVELEPGDIALLFLSSITVNFEDHSLNLTFGNRFNKFDPKALFDDMLGHISKSANTLNYLKEILYPIKSGEFNAMQEAVQTARDITMASALAADNEEVVIDGSGYTGKKRLPNGTYDPRQVKITGKSIVFTDDAWETCKTAIGELLFGDNYSVYGINAQALIGQLIMGNNLHIVDSNGVELLTVVDNHIQTHVEDTVDAVVNGDASGHQPDGTDSIKKQITEIKQTADNVTIIVTEQIASTQDGEHYKVNAVETTTGYKFDVDGLDIYKQGHEIRNRVTHTGMYVTRSGEDILTADNSGVNAINLEARQYLIIGNNSRFENYSNGTDANRTACF